MMRHEKIFLPAAETVVDVLVSKKMPGERWSCETITRSVPLMMKVPLLGHDRDLPEVDLLLLHVADRLRALGVVPGDEPDRHLERRGVGHAALEALLHVVLRLLERVADELERRGVVEVLDREDRVEHGLQAGVLALLRLDVASAGSARTICFWISIRFGISRIARDLREVLADAERGLGEEDLGHGLLALR